jgi:NADH-quinone oxidoreductase subunit I
MCEEACPVDAIELTSIYDLTGHSRQEMLYDREKLLEVYDRTVQSGHDPKRTRIGMLGPASDIVTTLPATGGGASVANETGPSTDRGIRGMTRSKEPGGSGHS